MTMIYRTLDKKQFTVETDSEFVDLLCGTSFITCKDAGDYMEQFSRRAYNLLGIWIRIESPKVFVQDLVEFRLVELVNSN